MQFFNATLMSSRREEKEAFVSGHVGTTAMEVSLVAAAPVALLLLWRLMRSPESSGGAGTFLGARPALGELSLEFAVLVAPQVAHLLGVAQPAALLAAAATLALALFLTQDSYEWQEGRTLTARRQPPAEQLR